MKRKLALSILLLTGMTGCGAAKIASPEDASDAASSDAEAANGNFNFDSLVAPPQGYYDALFTQALQLADQPSEGSLGPKDPEVLWLNFNGAKVTKGFGDGESFIPCKSTIEIPAPDLSAADRDDIVARVQQFYNDAGANLYVTQDKPDVGPFTTIHVGGTYANLGCRGGATTLGIAPLDTGNANRSDVGFAFTPSYANATLIADTIAHEAGHSYGLNHVVDRSLLMFASATPDMTGFGVSRVVGSGRIQDDPAILQQALGASDGSVVVPPSASNTNVSSSAGNTSPTTIPNISGLPNLPPNLATLPGLDQIGNLGQLLPTLANNGTLDITTIMPLVEAILPIAGIAVPGLNEALTIIGIASQVANHQQGGNASGLPIDPALASLILTSATGVPVDVTQLAGLAGFADVTQAVSALQTIFGRRLGSGNISGVLNTATSSTKPTSTNASATTVPDLSTFLGLTSNINDLPTLILSFAGSAQVVNTNYSGQTQAALLSLLKVAYSQQYQTISSNI